MFKYRGAISKDELPLDEIEEVEDKSEPDDPIGILQGSIKKKRKKRGQRDPKRLKRTPSLQTSDSDSNSAANTLKSNTFFLFVTLRF